MNYGKSTFKLQVEGPNLGRMKFHVPAKRSFHPAILASPATAASRVRIVSLTKYSMFSIIYHQYWVRSVISPKPSQKVKLIQFDRPTQTIRHHTWQERTHIS
jgi:hypothetical protein